MQSRATGLFFFATTASYLLGLLDYSTLFSKDYNESRIWGIALVLNLMHLAYMILKRQLLPEHFPFSTLALFCWNDEQWVRLHRLCTEEGGDTRVVCTSEPMDLHAAGKSRRHLKRSGGCWCSVI